MSSTSFLTIESNFSGSYREKGSKFLAFAFPVLSERDIKSKIDLLKKEYHDARHHCFAWILGADSSRFKAFDDGEPNHSAGDPILGQIRSRKLTNTLVVVVRYFGGIKLGVGGLINAYRLAASDCLDKAVVIEKEITETVSIQYDYDATPEVMKLVKQFDLEILEQSFNDQCLLQANIRIAVKVPLYERAGVLMAMGLKMKLL